MIRIVQVVAVVAAIVGAFLLGRFTARGPQQVRPATVAMTDSADASGPAAVDREDVADAARASARRTSPAASVAATAGSAAGSVGAGLQASGGPRPLLETDLPRFTETEDRIRADRGAWADLLELSEKEERDDDAQRLEQMLALSIRRHGDHMTALRLSSPRCTHSVCILRGVGLGDSQDPRSDWQRLLGKLMSEPWFRNAFDDMRGSVGGDSGETLYHTILVRCEPGTCRWARR